MEREFQWLKGDFVINSRVTEEWGTGIVTEDQRDSFVKVFFENTSTVKAVKAEMLERVKDPGVSRKYLEHALVDEETAAKYDREPFPSVLKRYLELFPGGFRGERHHSEERDYKMVAVYVNLHSALGCYSSRIVTARFQQRLLSRIVSCDALI